MRGTRVKRLSLALTLSLATLLTSSSAQGAGGRKFYVKEMAPATYRDFKLRARPTPITVGHGGRAEISSTACEYNGPRGKYSNRINLEAKWCERSAPGSKQDALLNIDFNPFARTQTYLSPTHQARVTVRLSKPNRHAKGTEITQAQAKDAAIALLRRIEALSLPWPEVYRRAQFPTKIGRYYLSYWSHGQRRIGDDFSYNRLLVQYELPYQGELRETYAIQVAWYDPQDSGLLSPSDLADSFSTSTADIVHAHESKRIASAHYDKHAKEMGAWLSRSERDRFDHLSQQLVDRLAPLAVDRPAVAAATPGAQRSPRTSSGARPSSDPSHASGRNSGSNSGPFAVEQLHRPPRRRVPGSSPQTSPEPTNSSNRPTVSQPVPPERVALVTTAAIGILLASGVSIGVAQSVATAIAQAVQAGIDVTSQDIANAIADGKRQAGVTRSVTLSGDDARQALQRGVGSRIDVPDGERHDLEISGPEGEYRDGYRGDRGRIQGIGPIITDEDGNITIGVDVEFDRPGSGLNDDDRDAADRLANEIDQILHPPPDPDPDPEPPPTPDTEPEPPKEPRRAPPTMRAPTGPPPVTIPDLERELDKAKDAAWWAKWRMNLWRLGLAATDYPTRAVDWTFGLASAFTGPAASKGLNLGYGSLRSLGKWLGRSLVDGKWKENAIQVGGEFATNQAFSLALGGLFEKVGLFQGATPNFANPSDPARMLLDKLRSDPEVAGQLAELAAKRVTQKMAEWALLNPAKNKSGLFRWSPP